MFFILSKILGFFALPSNLSDRDRARRSRSCCCTRFHAARQLAGGDQPRAHRRCRFVAARQCADPAAGAALSALGSLARAAGRHCRARRCDHAGRSVARGAVALNEAAERITATVELARRYPNARIIFSGGTAALIQTPAEAAIAVREFEALGVAHDRITAEEQSRNTIENAVFSRLIAQPKPGERWLLVTSAYHMPRAMAAFRAAGFPVEAYPVDWRTRGPIDATAAVCFVGDGLRRTDFAVHEWVGLAGLSAHRQDHGIVSRALTSSTANRRAPIIYLPIFILG